MPQRANESKSSDDDACPLICANYCVLFVDLLGQRAALRGQGLIPTFKSDEDREVFERTVRTSIGAISELQRDAETFMFGHDEVRRRSALREHLSADEQKVWDELAVHPEVKLQRQTCKIHFHATR